DEPPIRASRHVVDDSPRADSAGHYSFDNGQHIPTLFPELARSDLAHGSQPGTTALVEAFKLDAEEQYSYPLIEGMPSLVTELLPHRSDDFEMRLVSYVDFSSVLADRDRSRTKLVK